MNNIVVKDCNGKSLRVGDYVRILEIPNIEESLESEEWERVKSMKGCILQIYEIDKYGEV